MRSFSTSLAWADEVIMQWNQDHLIHIGGETEMSDDPTSETLPMLPHP